MNESGWPEGGVMENSEDKQYSSDKWWWVITIGILLWIGLCSVAVIVYLWRH